jgi:RNA polymerase sigma factor (sigma-70 family)
MISPERSHELLCAYAATRCGGAFRELVAGWSGMVYATALRVSRGREALAEDITQAVFSRLAAAPEKVNDARALGAWLHAAATGSTLAALRVEARRRRREETSQHLIMHTPEPSVPDAGDGRHELMPEIDGALSKLPPQDSEILLMRFWQQQDWRSIGRNFGLSDDAAQKRMSRALERLRRILARRGITSTAGVLSAVLAGTVPRDLPAAAVLKIFSATQVSTSTVLTTVVMTAKTKAAIAAAIVITAAAPILYQQQRIAALEGEVQSLQQRAPVPAANVNPVTAAARERDFAQTVPAKRRDLANPLAPKDSDPAGPATREDGPPDIDAMNRGKMTEKLAVLRTRLSLTPEQEQQIAKALEYGQLRFKIDPPNVIPVKPTADDIRKMEDGVLAALTADQQKEYQSFREDEQANALEAVANRELSRLQSMTTLTQEQKDLAFAAFSEIASREINLPVLDPDKEAEAISEAEKARWAARQEALGAILTPEQMAVYQQADNPFRRGTGS